MDGDFGIRFIDYFMFLRNSIETLTKNYTNDNFNAEKKCFGMMIRKDVYPYDYIDGPEIINETEQPPGQIFQQTLR